MEKGFLLRRLLFILLILFFSFPFLHLWFYLGHIDWSLDSYFFKAIQGSFVQALFSAVVTLVLSLLGALSLIHLQDKWKTSPFKVLETLFLLPAFVPPLIFVLLFLKWLWFMPLGLWGIVSIHVLMNVGVMSFLLKRLFVSKGSQWSELCLVEGVQQWRFLCFGLLPSLKKDLVNFFLFLFISFFTSFSVPFLVGGAQYGGVEVFIYEKIFLFQEWGEALFMAFSLSFLFIISAFFISTQSKEVWGKQSFSHPTSLLKLSWSSFILLLPLPILFLGLIPYTSEIFQQRNLWPLIPGNNCAVFGLWFVNFLYSVTPFFLLFKRFQSQGFVCFCPSWLDVCRFLFVSFEWGRNFDHLLKSYSWVISYFYSLSLSFASFFFLSRYRGSRWIRLEPWACLGRRFISKSFGHRHCLRYVF